MLATDSAVGERKLSGTVLYKEEGLIPPAAVMTMIKESDVKEVPRHSHSWFTAVVKNILYPNEI